MCRFVPKVWRIILSTWSGVAQIGPHRTSHFKLFLSGVLAVAVAAVIVVIGWIPGKVQFPWLTLVLNSTIAALPFVILLCVTNKRFELMVNISLTWFGVGCHNQGHKCLYVFFVWKKRFANNLNIAYPYIFQWFRFIIICIFLMHHTKNSAWGRNG